MGNSKRQKEKGAVSLFIVIFSALLILTITTAFVGIMLQDQRQASADDLSKSALDSANAGVEDAKRMLALYEKRCPTGPSTNSQCGNMFTLMDGTHCDAIQKTSDLVTAQSNGEVQVGDDPDLNQTYSCVKITVDTDDYIGILKPNESRLIHLKTKNNQPFDTVNIQWFSRSDLYAAPALPDGTRAINLGTDSDLPEKNAWPADRPSLMRAQLLQIGTNFQLENFDVTDVENANTATVFMMPSRIGSNGLNFTDGYASGPLQLVKCDSRFSSVAGTSNYGCNQSLRLPLPVGATSLTDRKDAYLRLLAPYNFQTSFRITLSNSSNPSSTVYFGGVQPEVDATGRANDLFRRVISRVEPRHDFPYVEGALDISGDLCKTFTVGGVVADFKPGPCTP